MRAAKWAGLIVGARHAVTLPGGSVATLPEHALSDAGALVTLPRGASVDVTAACVSVGETQAFTGLPPARGGVVH